MKLNELFIVQPILASYRTHFINELSNSFGKVTVFANLEIKNGFKTDVDGDFEKVHTKFIGVRKWMYYQPGIIQALLINRPSHLFITADLRALHFWVLLFLCRVLNIKVFSHGQGIYDKPQPGLIRKILFRIITLFSAKYVCYTKSVEQSLLSLGIEDKKLLVMDNTITNDFCILPANKNATTDKVLFIGRLREGCNLELLFEALLILKEKNSNLTTEIIGDGSQSEHYKKLAKELDLKIIFHGAIYEDEKISQLSKNAIIGVYPGDAGLSIVHYMSLSVVPIVHDNLFMHMGPEPSYVKDGENGLLFNRGNKHSLAKKIDLVLKNKKLALEISNNAFCTYKQLLEPSMALKLIRAMEA